LAIASGISSISAFGIFAKPGGGGDTNATPQSVLTAFPDRYSGAAGSLAVTTEISALSVEGEQAHTVAIVATSKTVPAGVLIVLDTLTPLSIGNIDYC
jgi:hypothetical protein